MAAKIVLPPPWRYVCSPGLWYPQPQASRLPRSSSRAVPERSKMMPALKVFTAFVKCKMELCGLCRILRLHLPNLYSSRRRHIPPLKVEFDDSMLSS